jgi:hypothetical protein
MYRWLIFFHILGVFGFLLSHGASVHMAFAVRRERDLERLRALLQLSSGSYRTMYPSLLVIVLTGIIAGFQGQWWKSGWIWAFLVLLIGIASAMYPLGTAIFGAARSAIGMPHVENGEMLPGEATKSPEEIDAILKKAKPVLLAAIGYGGLALLAWLMVLKPF